MRKPEVFADFESSSYGKWKKTGTAFGDRARAIGTLPNQQKVSGYRRTRARQHVLAAATIAQAR